jgi:hypothetical protein
VCASGFFVQRECRGCELYLALRGKGLIKLCVPSEVQCATAIVSVSPGEIFFNMRCMLNGENLGTVDADQDVLAVVLVILSRRTQNRYSKVALQISALH